MPSGGHYQPFPSVEEATGVFRAAMTAALHYSEGKPGVDQIPPEVLLDWGRVFTYGERKYARDNWKRGNDWHEFYGSLLRHALKWWQGEDLDPESGLPHLAHVLWNAGALHYFQLRGIGQDDRDVWDAIVTSSWWPGKDQEDPDPEDPDPQHESEQPSELWPDFDPSEAEPQPDLPEALVPDGCYCDMAPEQPHSQHLTMFNFQAPAEDTEGNPIPSPYVITQEGTIQWL